MHYRCWSSVRFQNAKCSKEEARIVTEEGKLSQDEAWVKIGEDSSFAKAERREVEYDKRKEVNEEPYIFTI